ncbi:MAG TPA: iron ABC transporter permease [Gemmatimonadaceae bacterium]|nr:iron ABC transporter permease [Gemmatimonadaceae bacterium]
MVSRRTPVLAAAALLALAALTLAAVAWGSVHIPVRALAAAVAGHGDPTTVAIVRTLRLPRVTLALLVGAALGMSGGALQATLRNALAEPYLLGVSGGAAVGAVLATVAGLRGPFMLPLAAFGGAVVAIVAALLVSRAAGGRADPRVLLMAGVIIGAFANAAIMLVLAGAPADTVRGAVWWMMGSVAGADWRGVAAMGAYLAVGGALLLVWAREIDILALGVEPAAALGVDVERSARRVYLVSALLAAATVAAAGLVGFVGLIVPHLVRGAGVRRHRALLGGAAVAGAALVVGADLIARVARPPMDLPLGAVTAVLGVPFFLVQLRRLR